MAMDGNGSSASTSFAARVGDEARHMAKQPGEVTTPPAEADELIAPGDIYATAGGQRMALVLEFIHRDKRSFSVPYSYLPLLWWEPPGRLTIEYPNLFSVLLEGKELEELHRRIKDHRITWVREFDERQAAALSSAVTRIAILGTYPSREIASDRHAAIAGEPKGV